jgi:hypothetical protein
MPGLDEIKAATRGLHVRAERSGVIADILGGRASRPAVALLLRGLLPVYQVLDLSTFGHLALARVGPIEADLQTLAPGADVALLPEGAAYGEQVRAAGEGLVAHAYVRYLGDLNGGPLIERCLGAAGAGLTFFAHPGIADPSGFARDFRAHLDRVVRAADFDAVLREVMVSFEMTIALSEAVKASVHARCSG